MADSLSQSEIDEFCIDIDGEITSISSSVSSVSAGFSSTLQAPVSNAATVNDSCCNALSIAITSGIEKLVNAIQGQYAPLSLQLASTVDGTVEFTSTLIGQLPESITADDKVTFHLDGIQAESTATGGNPYESSVFIINPDEAEKIQITGEIPDIPEITKRRLPPLWSRFLFCDMLTGNMVISDDFAAFGSNPRFQFLRQVNNPDLLAFEIGNNANLCEAKPDGENEFAKLPEGAITCALHEYDTIENLDKSAGTLSGAWLQMFNWIDVELKAEGKRRLGMFFGFLQFIVAIILAVPMMIIWILGIAAKGVMHLFGCDIKGRGDAWSLSALTGFLGIFAPGAFDQINTKLGLVRNRLCPVNIPDIESCIAAYLGDNITLVTLKGLVEANGYCWEPYERILESRKAKTNPAEILALLNREEISESEARRRLRNLGYVDDAEIDQILKLRFIMPNQSDLIRMMVRDADDKNIVERFKLDTEFDEKIPPGGQIEKWAKSIGLDKDILKYVWRSHWVIPAPGQLFEMLQRLERLPLGDPARVTWGDVETALKQQDILPDWIAKYKAIAYRPLTRVDVRRAYDIGELKEADVKESYLQQGYDENNAQLLTNFASTLKQNRVYGERAIKLWVSGQITREQASERLANLGYNLDKINDALETSQAKFRQNKYVSLATAGRIPLSKLRDELIRLGVSDEWAKRITEESSLSRARIPAIVKYKRGLITRDNAMQTMVAEFIPVDIAATKLDDIDEDIKSRVNGACAGFIVERFVGGELTEDRARALLAQRLIEPARVDAAIEAAKCKLDAMDKSVSVSQLCSWHEQGIFNAVELLRRIRNLGYSGENARRIVDDCIASINERRAKRQQKEIDDAAKAEKKRLAEVKRNAADLRKASERAIAASNAAAKARESRANKIMNAAEKYSKLAELQYQSAISVLNEVKSMVNSEYGLSLNQSVDATVQAVDAMPTSEVKDIRAIARLTASQFVANSTSQPSGDGSDKTSGETTPSAPSVPSEIDLPNRQIVDNSDTPGDS